MNIAFPVNSKLADAADPASIVEVLGNIVRPANVVVDAAEREFYSQDIFTQGTVCAAVVKPSSAEQLSAIVRATVAAGYDLVTRGGGMSYTGGYLPQRPETIIVDISALDRVLEVNETDMYVTVEAGCTWDALRIALEPTGLRTPYWGPLSGLRSTVGGALSQNSVFSGRVFMARLPTP